MNHAAAIVLLLLCSTVAFSQPQTTTKSKKAYELYVQADNFRVRGQFEEAINLLQQALDKDDKFVEAYFRLGVTYANMKENPKAIATYEKGLALTNDLRFQKQFWYELGELYLLTGDYEKAMKVLSASVLFLTPKSSANP